MLKQMFFLLPLSLTMLVSTQELQAAEIQYIDFYGLRSTSLETASEALGVKVGHSLDIDRPAAKQRLLALDEIEDVMIIEMFMPGNEILLVGVQEKGSPILVFNNAPEGKERLPQGMVEAYSAALELGYEGMMKHEGGEERINGHSFSKYPPAAKQQHLVASLALAHPEQVRAVLRNANDPEQRAVAAKAMSYFEDKESIVEDLAFAISDPDSSVRNNAIRALAVLAKWANGQKNMSVEFDYLPLFTLLESLEWTDRNKAAALLDSLTLGRNEALLSQLRERAIPALAEMAKWHSVGHAAFSIRILGRLAGLSEEEISRGEKRAWSGDYEDHVSWVKTLEGLAVSMEKSVIEFHLRLRVEMDLTQLESQPE